MRKSSSSYPLLSLAGLMLAGSCSIIAEVDRTKIPTDGGPPPEGGQSSGGTSNTGGTGKGGKGGTGGARPTGGAGGASGAGGEGGETGGTGGTGGDAGGGTGGDAGGGTGGDSGAGGEGGSGGPVCGDGQIEGNEECDDGDAPANGDGCSMTCLEEAGWTCTNTPSNCVTTCNDRIVAGNEACDDGNAIACGTCGVNCSTATPLAAATGTITLGATAPTDIDEADSFTINDGANAVAFEFDITPGDGAAGSNVAVVFDPAGTAAALQSAVIAAINAQGPFTIQASAGAGTNVTLTNQVAGAQGNTSTLDNVNESSFAISLMFSGGAAKNCAAGTGCKTDDDCVTTCNQTNHQCNN